MKKLTLRIPTIDLLSSKKLKGGYTITLPEVIVYPPESPFDPPDDPRGDDPRNDPDDPRDDPDYPDYPDHPDHPNPGDHGQNNSDNGPTFSDNLTQHPGFQAFQDWFSNLPQYLQNLNIQYSLLPDGETADARWYYSNELGCGVIEISVSPTGELSLGSIMEEIYHQLLYEHYGADGIYGENHSAIEMMSDILDDLTNFWLTGGTGFEQGWSPEGGWGQYFDDPYDRSYDGFHFQDFIDSIPDIYEGWFDYWREHDPDNTTGYMTGYNPDFNWDLEWWFDFIRSLFDF